MENLKIAAQTYNEVGSIVELEQKISAASATGKEAKQTVRKYESQIILYGGARRMLEQAGISLKGLNINKLKSEYPALTAQKNRSAEAPPFPQLRRLNIFCFEIIRNLKTLRRFGKEAGNYFFALRVKELLDGTKR